MATPEGSASTSVSVALATYQGAAYLQPQLDSIAAQERLPDEVVVCDDASTDRTWEILTGWRRSAPFDVHLFRNEHRLGFRDNFDQVMRRCRGELIALCDQDDVWQPAKLARCAGELDARPQATVVAHACTVVDEWLHPTGERYPDLTHRQVHAPGRFPLWITLPGFATVFRSRLLTIASSGRLQTAYPTGGDVDATVIAHDELVYFLGAAFGEIVVLPDQLALHRRHAANVTPGVRRPRSAAIRESLGMADPAGTYRWLAGLAAERSRYLDRLDKSNAVGAAELRRRYDRAERVLRRRARLHGNDSRVGRVAMLAAHLAHGDYGGRAEGGLGWRAVAKDALLGLRR